MREVVLFNACTWWINVWWKYDQEFEDHYLPLFLVRGIMLKIAPQKVKQYLVLFLNRKVNS